MIPLRMEASDWKIYSLNMSCDSDRDSSSSSRISLVHKSLLERMKSRARVQAASLRSGDGMISVLSFMA